MKGVVTDTHGNPVPGANINIKSGGTAAYSGQDGYFWKLLPPGVYTVSISAPEYGSVTKVNISR